MVTILDRVRLRRVTEVVEGASSQQLVCPYCKELQRNTVVLIFPDVVHTCDGTYIGSGCGARFIGPGPARQAS
jgi:hypothetical protein